MGEPREMTTYRRADGELIGDDWSFACDIESCEVEAEQADDPIEYVEEVWALVSERRFILPTCKECDAPATHWGLCEPHAREDDPESFANDFGGRGSPNTPVGSSAEPPT